jgi:hypothetical protein
MVGSIVKALMIGNVSTIVDILHTTEKSKIGVPSVCYQRSSPTGDSR